MTTAICGLLPLDKKPGLTSHQTIAAIKRQCGVKIGHTGTLDRFASGLLLVLLGKLTTLSAFFTDMDKEYETRFRFGEQTATLDPEGDVVERGPVPAREKIEKCLGDFIGEIEQIPPAYSAVHVDGERAYKIARKGGTPVIRPRRIHIYEIQVLDYEQPDLRLRVRCSKGTYVRALARDLGRRLATCAYVTDLRRTAQGEFKVENAADPEQIDLQRDIRLPAEFLRQIPDLTCRVVKDAASELIRFGKPVSDSIFEDPPNQDGRYALLDRSQSLVSIVERQNGQYKYRRVYLNTGL